MNNETEFWQFALDRLSEDQFIALLMVVQSSGSSPGRPGFKMIVAADEIYGSIGGGVMEMELVERAKVEIQNASALPPNFSWPKRLIRQVHRRNVPDASGMICSGEQTVLFEILRRERLDVIRSIIDRLAAGERFELFVTESEFTLSQSELAHDFHFQELDAAAFVYSERVGALPKLFIVGGGHCALALSEIMARLDFQISLFDDRPKLNTIEKNRFAQVKTIVDSYENIDQFVPAGPDNYVVVMTLGYKYDEMVIRRLLEKDFKYFGVLGSRAKMKTLLASLAKEGFDTVRLGRIRTPVGIPINSRTPAEIAVSIAAEIISVKNSKI